MLFVPLARADEILGEKPEMTERELQQPLVISDTFGPSREVIDAINLALATTTKPLERCHRRAGRRHEAAEGLWHVRFFLRRDGTVETVLLEGVDDAPRFEACATEVYQELVISPAADVWVRTRVTVKP
jgi:hypothetical protein